MNKKLIIGSLLPLMAASTLLVGASYALFTSETNVDIAVTSGKVEVTAKYVESSLKLYSLDNLMPATTFTNGGTAKINDLGDQLTISNITPGDKLTFELAIDNTSNVAIKYKVSLNPIGENPLEGGLTLTCNETTSWISVEPNAAINNSLVEIEMPYETGDEYQNSTATYAIIVNAVQGNAIQ